MILKISQSSKENTYARASFLIKLQASICNFIKNETLAQVFSCEFCEIFKNTFIEHLRWLLLIRDENLLILDYPEWYYKFGKISRISFCLLYYGLVVLELQNWLLYCAFIDFSWTTTSQGHLGRLLPLFRYHWGTLRKFRVEYRRSKISGEKLFWKYTANSQENIHAEVWFQ